MLEIIKKLFPSFNWKNTAKNAASSSDKSLQSLDSNKDTPIPVIPPSALKRWRLAIDAATAPFADTQSDRLEKMLDSQSYLLTKQRVNLRFSNQTGLVRLLRGELDPDRTANSPQEMLQIADDFLRRFELALFGVADNSWQPDSQPDKPPIIGSAVRYRQVDRAEIPVYGGLVQCGFNDTGQLTIFTSSWYPLPLEANYRGDFILSWGEAGKIARKHVAKVTESSPSPADPNKLETRPDVYYPNGQVIFPWYGPKTGAQYHAGWIVLVVDQEESRSWEFIVEATTGQILDWSETGVGATLRSQVYSDNTHAINSQTSLEDLLTTPNPLDPNMPQLASATDFLMQGAAFAEPPEVAAASIPNTDPAFRSANVYYHLRQAKEKFEATVQKVWPAGGSNPPLLPGSPTKPLPVHLLDNQGNAVYDSGLILLRFYTGEPGFQPPIKDPALDSEVIYHEFTHAVLHTIQPDIFGVVTSFARAINEGVAFYYGCTLSERTSPGQPALINDCNQASRWGEFAYEDATWGKHRTLRHNAPEANHDYLSIYGVFPSYANDPDPDPVDNRYACGMVWARTLWDIRCLLGYDIADDIILRGLNLAGGVQTEMETLAEAIIHADSEYTAGGPSHENALRLIFASRGIMADTPIHDLVKFNWAGQTYLLAATEGVSTNPSSLGCLYSFDNGDSWQPLGTTPLAGTGPTVVVALTIAPYNDGVDKVAIWTISEDWDLSKPGSVAKIYRCDLIPNTLIAAITWQHVADVPDNANVFSLAAMHKPGGVAGDFWLFVGTEDGLYKYDNGWSSPYLFGNKVFDLAMTPMAPPKLLTAADNRLRIFNNPATSMANIPKTTKPNDHCLAIAIDPSGNYIWVGTAFSGIYQFDQQGNLSANWLLDSTTLRPVHSLVVEEVGQNPPKWRVYAGTNNGVYRCIYQLGPNTTPNFDEGPIVLNAGSNPNGEALQGVSVAALCRVGNRLVAGTAQRGLWWRQVDPESNTGWTRVTNGLSRIGLLTDVDLPPGTPSWTSPPAFFTGSLPAGGVATRVIHLPPGQFSSLSFNVTQGNANNLSLRLHYMTSPTNPGFGLQSRTLGANGIMIGNIQAGYYLLAVKVTAAENNYTINGQLTA